MNSITIPWKKRISKNQLGHLSKSLAHFASTYHLEILESGISLKSGLLYDQLSLIKRTFDAAGFEMELEQKEFRVEGMSCANCAITIESMVQDQEGIVASTLNYANAQLWVQFIPSLTHFDAIKEILQKTGYDIIERISADLGMDEQDKVHLSLERLKWRAVIALVLCIPIVLLGMFFMEWSFTPYLLWVLSTPVIFGLGYSYFFKAWNLARNKMVSMDTLVSVSSIVAYGTSVVHIITSDHTNMVMTSKPIYFESAAVVIAFLLLGKWLEEKTKAKTGTAIRKLMSLHPDRVMRQSAAGKLEEISISEIKLGDVLLVRPGERLAVDGMVESGDSYIDESLMTGEVMPVHKFAGQWVYSGTLNQSGSFKYKAHKVGTDTQLSQMIQWVRQAQGSKAPVQKMTDRIATVFVPLVMVIAVLSCIAWIYADPIHGRQHGLLALVTVLIVACPCALGLATPTAVIAGMGKAAQYGILIRDMESLERVHKVDLMFFDKTGTLTEGSPILTSVRWYRDANEYNSRLLGLARNSTHPLALALTKILDDKNPSTPEQFENIPGQGIKGSYDSRSYFIGSTAFLNEKGIDLTEEQNLEFQKFETHPASIVLFFDEASLISMFVFEDKLKEGVPEAIHNLKRNGVKPFMLTGDRSVSASYIASQAGIEDWKAELSPKQKLEELVYWQNKGKSVAMVGDGINDSAALAQADLSIAMGLGADIAKESAGMIILSSDLRRIPIALRISTQTLQTIKQNLWWAFIYNLIGIPLAAGLFYPLFGIWMSPMLAGLAMAFSSVSVVLNSLRMKYRAV